MKLSKEDQKLIKNGIITKKILAMAIYSYNKRAKNMRDNERKYRHYYTDWYNNEEKAKEKKEEYYRKKTELLKYIKPSAIHYVIRLKNKKIYEYEKQFNDINEKDVKYINYYYDYKKDDYVYFKIIEEPFVEKYLFYDLGDYSFHSPLTETGKKYNLPIVKLDNLETYGKDINSLIFLCLSSFYF